MIRGFEIDSETRRQHINISNEANNVIELDIKRFMNKGSKSGFINEIITNFHDEFILSENKVFKDIVNNPYFNEFNSSEKEQQIEVFKDELMKRSFERLSKKFKSEFPFKLKLNVDNYHMLIQYPNAKYFDDHAPHYAGLAFFIKIILEEYARKDIKERERIYFKDTVKIVRESIKNNKKVSWIYEGKREKLDLIDLYRNPKTKRITVVGAEFKDEFKGKHSSYLRTLTDKDQYTYELDIKQLKNGKVEGLVESIYNASKNNRLLFIRKLNPSQKSTQPIKEFLLKFNNSGLIRLNNEIYSFDFILEETASKNEYIIKTSESELFYHFFNYAFEVEILKPLDVRERFGLIYKKAFELYSSDK